METGNVDLMLDQIGASECHEASEELARYLHAGLPATRQLLAAFLNDLNNECLIRWGLEVNAAKAGAPLYRVGEVGDAQCDTRGICDSEGPCSLRSGMGAGAAASTTLPQSMLGVHACRPRQLRQ